ncbi:MAG: hypothetical protein R2788_24615 [Saprospiraceae bacterium]
MCDCPKTNDKRWWVGDFEVKVAWNRGSDCDSIELLSLSANLSDTVPSVLTYDPCEIDRREAGQEVGITDGLIRVSAGAGTY